MTNQATPRLAATMQVHFGVTADGGERILLGEDRRDVTREIRTEEAGQGASRVAVWPQVRAALLERQQAFAQPPAWWPTAGIWAPWCSLLPASKSI